MRWRFKDSERDYLPTLVEIEGGDGLQLIWSRPVGRDSRKKGSATEAGPLLSYRVAIYEDRW